MKKNLLFVLARLIAVLALTGCAAQMDQPLEDQPNKEDLLLGKADASALCAKFGLEPGCDLCEHFDWYGDGNCDQQLIDEGLCQGPDPDCLVISGQLGEDPGTFDDDVLFLGKDGTYEHDIGFMPYARSYLALSEGPLRFRHGSGVPSSEALTDAEHEAMQDEAPGKALDQAATVFGYHDLGFEWAASSPEFYNPSAKYWEGKCHAWCWSALDPWVNEHVEVAGPIGKRGLWIGGQWISRADLGNWVMGLSDNFAKREEEEYNKTNLTAMELLQGVWQYMLRDDASGVIADIFLDQAHSAPEVWNQPFYGAKIAASTLDGAPAEALLAMARGDGAQDATKVKLVKLEARFVVESGDDNESQPSTRARTWNIYAATDRAGKVLWAITADDERIAEIENLPTKTCAELVERWWKPTHETLRHALDGSEDLLLDFIDTWNGKRLRFFLRVVLAKGVPGRVRMAFEREVSALRGAVTDEQAQDLAARYPGIANAYSPEQWDRTYGALGLRPEDFGATWQQ